MKSTAGAKGYRQKRRDQPLIDKYHRQGDRAQYAMETRQEPVHGKKAYLGRSREQARERQARERIVQPLTRIDALDRQTT